MKWAPVSFRGYEELCTIAEPNFGIITNIGRAHLEGFGSFEGVLKTKKELYDFIQSIDGQLFLNADDDVLRNICPKEIESSTYGKKSENINGNLVRLTPFAEFEWSSGKYSSPLLTTKLVEYNFYNFLAAICIGKHFGVSEENINRAIQNYRRQATTRSQVTKTERNTLIVDCYNANPTSMKSALESFVQIDHPNKFAILGDMREMGKESEAEHIKINEFISNHQLNVITVGTEFGMIRTQIISIDRRRSFKWPVRWSKGRFGVQRFSRHSAGEVDRVSIKQLYTS